MIGLAIGYWLDDARGGPTPAEFNHGIVYQRWTNTQTSYRSFTFDENGDKNGSLKDGATKSTYSGLGQHDRSTMGCRSGCRRITRHVYWTISLNNIVPLLSNDTKHRIQSIFTHCFGIAWCVQLKISDICNVLNETSSWWGIVTLR